MNEHDQRAPQDKVCGYEYTVRRGDSFYLIANRLGIPLRDLLEANSHINPARLMVGDVLCIPMEEDDRPLETAPVPETPAVPEAPPEEPSAPPEAPSPETPDDLDVPAQPGPSGEAPPACPEKDRYTVQQGEDVASIQLRADLNRYTLQQANPDADIDRLVPGQTLCVPPENTDCPARVTYTLQTDETLESVALRLNTSLAALLRANPCLAPSDFVAGRCIEIP